MSDVGAPPVVGIRWIEANRPPTDVDLRSADEWQILLELDGTACAAVTLPNPGEGAGPAFLTAAVLRHADGRRAHRGFVRGFRERLGAGQRSFREWTCSVVISTHRRPEYVAGALEALGKLDPKPFEVIVVDNDPGDQDCRAQAEAAGARYVREERRGLNAARTAGAREARGELVAYIDDDCIVSPHWLGQLPELFDDPLVAAVTGPAFAYELTTPAQRRRDVIAGFVHGFGRSTYDWTTLRPVHSGRVGAGANMIFRRDRLAELGDPFPPDLDGGTASVSGGDLYALYRVLAAGYRITYDPATFVFHRHRADAAALRGTVRGYGVGAAAFLTKTLVEEGELASFAIWRWLPQQYVVALMARAVGRGDAVAVRLRWEYLWNSFRGPAAWLSAHRSALREGPLPAIAPAPEPAAEHAAPAAPPAAASVIVCGRSGVEVERARAALGPGGGCEVVSATGRNRAAQRNAGAAKATGDVLVFLDAELVPEPGFVAEHLARLAAGDAPDVVLGYSPSRPSGGLAAKHDALWWEDHFTAKRDAVTLTFGDFVGSNMAVRRAAFERVGGFDEELEAHDDWEWGVRALRAGVRAVFHERAVARREPPPASALARIARAHMQGRDEVRLHERHGIGLPPGPERPVLVRLLSRTLDQGGAAPAAFLLDLLESLRARRAWLSLFRLALGAARERGWRQAGGTGMPGAATATVTVDLDAVDPIPAPRFEVPALLLQRSGETLARLSPRRAQWQGGLAEGAAGLLASVWWPEKENRWWTMLPGARAAITDDAGDVLDATRALCLQDETWDGADRAIRREGRERDFVGLVLPGVSASDTWLAAIAPAFEGSRVAAVVGAGLRDDEPPAALVIHSRTTLPGRYATGLGRPFQYVAVNPRIYEQLGGFDLEAAAFGDQAPVLDLVERALAAGFVIGYRDTPGLDPAGCYRPERSRNEWQRWAAAGALLARDARRSTGAGGWLRLAGRVIDGMWARLIAGDGRRWWIGSRLALLTGVRRGLRR